MIKQEGQTPTVKVSRKTENNPKASPFPYLVNIKRGRRPFSWSNTTYIFDRLKVQQYLFKILLEERFCTDV